MCHTSMIEIFLYTKMEEDPEIQWNSSSDPLWKNRLKKLCYPNQTMNDRLLIVSPFWLVFNLHSTRIRRIAPTQKITKKKNGTMMFNIHKKERKKKRESERADNNQQNVFTFDLKTGNLFHRCCICNLFFCRIQNGGFPLAFGYF